jgi:hypothetical protein
VEADGRFFAPQTVSPKPGRPYEGDDDDLLLPDTDLPLLDR